MRLLVYIFTCLLLCKGLCAQVAYPHELPSSLVKINPGLDKGHSKKVFLVYNVSSEALMEAIYKGTKFLTEKATDILYVPVFVNSVTDQKTALEFENNLAVQNIRNLDNSDYKVFKLGENDLPVLIAYDENNELCGSSHNVEDLVKIECLNNPSPVKYLRLKILTESKAKKLEPYANKKIFILDGAKTATLCTVNTDAYGDFEYRVADDKQDYVLQVPEKMPEVGFVVLATQSGKQVGKFNKTTDGFEYRLLQAELVKLPDLAAEEDVVLQLTRLDQPKTKDFTITENLFYELGKNNLQPTSKELLDKIITVMKAKPGYKLEIISHTDSQGDDADNLKLSESRSNAVIDYFVSKGISRNLLKGIGKGESEIRNRCTNGVECSDKEHEYNRRTEFRFIKN